MLQRHTSFLRSGRAPGVLHKDEVAAFAVHPGAVAPYERLTTAELGRLAPHLGLGDLTSRYVRRGRRAGRVLEYGAGRGNLTWELARRGVRVTAVELSGALMAELLERGRREPTTIAKQVTGIQGDMRSFRTSRRFPLVIAPEGTLLHLYNRMDVEAFLTNVHHHLSPGGRFVCDVPLPEPELLTRDYDPIAQVRYQDLGDSLLLAQRQLQPRELEMLLWYNGFRGIRIQLLENEREDSPRRQSLRRTLWVTATKGPQASAAAGRARR